MPIVSRKLLAVVLTAVCTCATGAVAQESGNAAPPDDAPALAQDPQAPFLVEPRTPEELFEATLRILNQARPSVARQYLDKFNASNPDDQLLLKLRTQYGMSEFLRMSQTRELQPVSSQLLQRVTDAFQRQNADPNYVDGLLDGLAGEPRDRTRAMFALQSGGPVIVPRILQRIALTQDATERDRFTYTLTQLGRETVPVLLGGVNATNDAVRMASITAVGYLGTTKAITPLLYPAFGTDQPDGVRAAAKAAIARLSRLKPTVSLSSHGVAQTLLTEALGYYRRQSDLPVNADGLVEMWTWDTAANTVSRATVDQEAASLFVGARLARQSLAVAPDNKQAQAVLLGFLLAEDVRSSGRGIRLATGPGTAHDLALLAGPEAVIEALDQALQNGNSLAARGCLRVLSQLASRRQLQFADARRGPLLAALNAPDPVVQYMAATAVLQLDPDRSFPLNERVVQILARTLNGSSQPHCLVVDADTARASQMGSLFGELGFEPLSAPTGRDGFKTASSRGDIALVALHLNTIRWPLSQTVANLRADSRTSAIPIVVFGEESMRSRVRGLLTRDPLTEFAPVSQTAENLQNRIGPFLASLRSEQPTPELQAELRENAAYWLAHIASGNRDGIFPLQEAQPVLISALNDAELASNALRTLSSIATTEAQQALCDTVLNSSQDAGLRAMASSLLAFHIQRFGLTLSDSSVRSLHEALGATADPALATGLATVIGSLKPNTGLVSERLRNFPLPSSPAADSAAAAGPAGSP